MTTSSWNLLLIFALVLLSCQPSRDSAGLANGVELRLNQQPRDPSYGSLEAVGLDDDLLAELANESLNREQWQELFPVFIDGGSPRKHDDKLPILGSYRLGETSIIFTPRFAFRRDLEHNARLELSQFYALLDKKNPSSKQVIEATFLGEASAAIPTTTVTAVYPTTDRVPANLLKLYVHFSAPMSQRNVQDYVHLFDFHGNEIQLPFVEIKEGLWDPDRQRLTLFFHPGRIKRAVAPNVRMGPPLTEGETYHLIIDRDWQDATGASLVEGFRRTLTVGPADRDFVDYTQWSVYPPIPDSRKPLRLVFPEPLDHALLHRMIKVTDSSGATVPGTIEVGAAETQWRFTPEAAWHAGSYRIVVETFLEDLAGNNLRGVFDREIQGEQMLQELGETVEITFKIGNDT